jgi:hypothetical protein
MKLIVAFRNLENAPKNANFTATATALTSRTKTLYFLLKRTTGITKKRQIVVLVLTSCRLIDLYRRFGSVP